MMNITNLIHLIAGLDNFLSNETDTDEPVMAITLDPRTFDQVVAAARHSNPTVGIRNRFEFAGVTIRKAVKSGYPTDTTQPEIKRTTR